MVVKEVGKNMRFLVLEENQRILRIYQKFFDAKGHQVIFAENGESCFERFSEEDTFDYIILDKSTKLGNMLLEDKIRIINPLQKILFLSPFMNLENSEISRETQELVEKPFAMVTVLGKIQLENVQLLIKVK